MCTNNQLDIICSAMAERYRETYQQQLDRVLLYGSYARGTNSDDSDIDIVAIVHGNRIELQHQLRSIWDLSSDLEIEYGTIISPTVIPYDEFQLYHDTLPYYQNIEKEGVVIA